MTITHWEMILRITVAAVLGGLIGLERDIHRRQAGLRTHLIVSMASATFMVVSAQFFSFQNYVPGNVVSIDTSRIAASVVAGVGFLGGGSILRTGATVQGLTTAAGLWLVAAIGLSAGSGMYPEAVFATILGLFALAVLRIVEDKKMVRRRVVLRFSVGPDTVLQPMDAIEAGLRDMRAKASDFDYERDYVTSSVLVSFFLLFPETTKLQEIASALSAVTGVRDVQVRVPA